MILIFGIVLIVLSIALHFYLKPRGGKVSRFVGTPWEPYVVILILGIFAAGVLVTFSGMTEMEMLDASNNG